MSQIKLLRYAAAWPRAVLKARPDSSSRVSFKPRLKAQGQGERAGVWSRGGGVVDRLAAVPGPGESYSDVILRIVELQAGA